MRAQIERFALRNVLARLPAAVQLRLAGGTPVVRAGRTLHPLLQLLMKLNAGPGMETLTPAQARRAYSRVIATAQADPVEMTAVQEESLAVAGGSIRLRLYVPRNAPARSACILYFHGGGHVIGNIDDYDHTVRFIAATTGCRLLNVDYRCAPEHRFPVAAEDAIAAYRHLQENAARLGVEPTRVALMGDSAGGNLSAVVALAARDRGLPPPRVQCLLYPVVDLRLVSPSLDTFAEGFGLTKALIRWFAGHYIRREADRLDPLASPLLAASHAGLAPAIVTVAGFDPLYDEGVAYARKLEAAGVPVTLLRHDDLTHAWVTMTAVPPARAALEQTCALLRDELNR